MIIRTHNIVTLVGAGAATAAEIKRSLQIAPELVAADGGAAHCLNADLTPEAVIGDMDSLPSAQSDSLAEGSVYSIAEQDSTDFDKALRNIQAPLVIGVGFAGARIDHQLACYNALVRHPDRRCILLSDTDIAFLAPPTFALDLPEGTRVSLFPMGLVAGASDGLQWPIQGLTFTPDGRIGTSNEATGPIELTMTAPKMLVILPKSQLENAAQALCATHGAWPAL